MDPKDALISGLVVSCVLLPAPVILAAIIGKENVERSSPLPKIFGLVLAAAAIYCCYALGYGLYGTTDKGPDFKVTSFVFSRFLFFGGAIVCLMIAAVSSMLIAGKSDVIKSSTGLQWPGFLAGLLAAQAVVFFQQCNMQSVFQNT